MATYIQLPYGGTAQVDTIWWFTASDDEIDRFFEKNRGFESDPMSVSLPTGKELQEFEDSESLIDE